MKRANKIESTVNDLDTKECRKPKKNKEIRKCYKHDKVGHIIKDCRFKQKIKIRKNQEESDKSDKEEDNKKKGFDKDFK